MYGVVRVANILAGWLQLWLVYVPEKETWTN